MFIIWRAALVGWVDGACTVLIFAAKVPSRTSTFSFACNMLLLDWQSRSEALPIAGSMLMRDLHSPS
jgi:hypothetical protein